MKNKKAAKVTESDAKSASGDREGSPASTASGPIASGLAAGGVAGAEGVKAAEGSAIVEDGDVKMEDVAGLSPEASRP